MLSFKSFEGLEIDYTIGSPYWLISSRINHRDEPIYDTNYIYNDDIKDFKIKTDGLNLCVGCMRVREFMSNVPSCDDCFWKIDYQRRPTHNTYVFNKLIDYKEGYITEAPEEKYIWKCMTCPKQISHQGYCQECDTAWYEYLNTNIHCTKCFAKSETTELCEFCIDKTSKIAKMWEEFQITNPHCSECYEETEIHEVCPKCVVWHTENDIDIHNKSRCTECYETLEEFEEVCKTCVNIRKAFNEMQCRFMNTNNNFLRINDNI